MALKPRASREQIATKIEEKQIKKLLDRAQFPSKKKG